MGAEDVTRLILQQFRELHAAKCVIESTYAGYLILAANLFPGWQLPLDDLFDFRGRF